MKRRTEYWLNSNCKSYSESEKIAPLIGAIHVIEFKEYAALLKKVKNLQQKMRRMEVDKKTARD